MPRVYQFDTELRDSGRSLAMRRKVMTNLKTAISFAQSRGLVAQNVARGVKIKADDRTEIGPLREGVDFPSRAELKARIENSTGRWRPFIVTAIFTGMRASELRGLAGANVDLKEGLIHVRQRADAWRRIGPPKSKAGARDIPLAPIVVNALRLWQADCPRGELGLVFPNTRGNIEGLQNISGRIADIPASEPVTSSLSCTPRFSSSLRQPCLAQAGEEALAVRRTAERSDQPRVAQCQPGQQTHKDIEPRACFRHVPEMGCGRRQQTMTVRKSGIEFDGLLSRNSSPRRNAQHAAGTTR